MLKKLFYLLLLQIKFFVLRIANIVYNNIIDDFINNRKKVTKFNILESELPLIK